MPSVLPPDDRIESFSESWDGQAQLAPRIFYWTDVSYVRTSAKETPVDPPTTEIPETFVKGLESDRYVIYSPLAGELGLVNRDTVQIISELKKKYPNPLLATLAPEAYCQVVGFLKRNTSLFRPKSHFVHHARIYRERLDLCLTSACDLRCVYCFAGGGVQPRFLRWNIAKTAIDLTVRNALRKGINEIEIAFQGDGEEFVAWPMMKRCTEYAHECTSQNGLNLRIWAISNGCLSCKMTEWAVKNLDSLSISLDGPPDVQDVQRPFPNGRESASLVMKTIHLVDELGGNYSLRATITQKSVYRMAEITAYVLENFRRVDTLVLDPLFPSYISSRSGWEPPTADDFVRGYFEALRVVEGTHLQLGYTGYFGMREITGYHCDAWGVHLAVVPEGFVTSCPLVTSKDDPRSEFCIYGFYQNGEFIYDRSKLKRILARNINHLSDCDNCFARWHCAGECYSRLMMIGDASMPLDSFRCSINRRLLLDQLYKTLLKSNLHQQ